MANTLVLVTVLIKFLILFKESETYITESFTILKSSLLRDGAWIECSLITANKILKESDLIWLNEINQTNNDDKDFNLTNDVVAYGTSTWKFYTEYNDLSCGYLSQDKYVRIKKWQLSFVSKASIKLNYTMTDNKFTINKINSTFYEIDYNPREDLLSTRSSSAFLKIFCNKNFDMPTMSSNIRLHLEEFGANGEVIYEELWVSGTDLYFTHYNSDGQKVAQEFNYFLNKIMSAKEQQIRINLQCVIENSLLNMLENSGDFYLIRKNLKSESSFNLKNDNLSLILSVVFGFIGLILLIAISVFVVRFRKANALHNDSDKKKIIQNKN